MAGISSKAAGVQENRYKYNTWERNQDMSLEIDESFYRSNDYQTGRFWQLDPKTENMEMWSPYASNYDNPIRYNDPKGDQPGCCDGDPIVAIGQLAKDFYDNGVVPAVAWINRNLNPVYGLANGTKVIATGTNLDGEQRSVASGTTEIAFSLLPGGSIEKTASKQVEQRVVQEGLEAAEKNVSKKAPSLSEQASVLSEKIGKNSVTLGTPNKQIRFDLVGKTHGNVPTPHMQVYNKNFVNGVQKNISRASKEAVPMTQQDLRIVRKYLEKLKK
jgi:hypothetical protein